MIIYYVPLSFDLIRVMVVEILILGKPLTLNIIFSYKTTNKCNYIPYKLLLSE